MKGTGRPESGCQNQFQGNLGKKVIDTRKVGCYKAGGTTTIYWAKFSSNYEI